MTTQVSSERRGYGRGLILGFTMAETMLLLVFCLLLAVGAILAIKDKELLETQESLAETSIRLSDKEQELAILQEAYDQLAAAAAPNRRTILDEEWRELRLAQAAAQKFRESGLTLQEAVDNAALTQAARTHGLTAETLAETVEKAGSVDSQGLSPDEVRNVSAAVKVLKEYGMAEAETASELAELLRLSMEEHEGAESPPHEWPPIINLSETDGQSFASGSAELTPDFKRRLGQVAPIIADIVGRYKVDIIEVIGHTDEQAMNRISSNMDRNMTAVLEGRNPIGALTPVDNAGLGLARALSVVTYLRGLSVLATLQNVTFIPMSGGQLVMPGDLLTDGTNSGSDPARRRIEIRVRQRAALPADATGIVVEEEPNRLGASADFP